MSRWNRIETRKEALTPFDGIADAILGGSDMGYYATYLQNTDTGEFVKGVGNTATESYRDAKEEAHKYDSERHRAARVQRERKPQREREQQKHRSEGGSRGGSTGAGGLQTAVGCLIVAVLLIYGAIQGSKYVIETYVIKTFNPTYVTSFEEAAQARAAETARRASEAKEAENALAEMARPGELMGQMERSLRANGYDFSASGAGGCLIGSCFEMDNHVWGCGVLRRHFAVVYSDDGGENFRILHEFDASAGGPSDAFGEPILTFVDRMTGFLAYDIFANGSRLYRTTDGGTTWERILTTGHMGLMEPSIARIRVDRRKIIVIAKFDERDIVSQNGGASWTSWIYLGYKKTDAETLDGGLTWHAAARRE